MVFTPPKSAPALPDPPDSISVSEFLSNETYGRFPLAKSKNPYTCGVTGKTYTALEVLDREDHLARAIGKELQFHPTEGSEWDRVVAIYAWNTIDYIPLTHAVHRLNGIVTPASAAYSASELEHQLRSSLAKAVFTCTPLLEAALKAAKAVGIPEKHVFLLPMPNDKPNASFRTVDDLIQQGRKLPEVPRFSWPCGQGARQVAFLCYSSGTSGLPKAVMISHRNVIANILQKHTFEKNSRESLGIETQVMLGVLPFSHIYGLVPITHLGTWRGDGIIVLPKHDLKQTLSAVARFKIEQLNIVPPILVQVLSSQEECQKHDLSSVRFVYTGAAPLGGETSNAVLEIYPKWRIGQGYGLTETATVVTSTDELDIVQGSTGTLIPGTIGKIIDADGKEVTSYDTPGELYVQSPAVALGYLANEKATAETFVWDNDGRWLRTGDEVVARKSPSGNDHFFVVDRVKELIKVNGHQVAPAELEAHLLTHPFVSDVAVIQVPDLRAGELPKAFVVKAGNAADEESRNQIRKHVEDHKAKHKWLRGGIEFIEIIPKSPSGKILRRLLRDKEKQARKATGAKL